MGAPASTDTSDEIARWEQQLKHRYTSEDKFYCDNARKAERSSGPPIVEPWNPRGNFPGRRYAQSAVEWLVFRFTNPLLSSYSRESPTLPSERPIIASAPARCSTGACVIPLHFSTRFSQSEPSLSPSFMRPLIELSLVFRGGRRGGHFDQRGGRHDFQDRDSRRDYRDQERPRDRSRERDDRRRRDRHGD